MSDTNSNGVKPFKISSLVNKVEPFRLEYDGFVLEGEWWKYKTTTPNYAKEFLESLPPIPETGTEEEKKKVEDERNKALNDFSAQVLTDTVQSWNAVDDDDQPLPISVETFNRLPQPFTEFFMAYLKDLREGAATEKKSQTSPST